MPDGEAEEALCVAPAEGPSIDSQLQLHTLQHDVLQHLSNQFLQTEPVQTVLLFSCCRKLHALSNVSLSLLSFRSLADHAVRALVHSSRFDICAVYLSQATADELEQLAARSCLRTIRVKEGSQISSLQFLSGIRGMHTVTLDSIQADASAIGECATLKAVHIRRIHNGIDSLSCCR